MAHSERLEIHLPRDLVAYVHEQVGQGMLATDSDVVAEALRALQEKQRAAKVAELRGSVDAAIARGGRNSAEDARNRMRATAEDLRKQGL